MLGPEVICLLETMTSSILFGISDEVSFVQHVLTVDPMNSLGVIPDPKRVDLGKFGVPGSPFRLSFGTTDWK